MDAVTEILIERSQQADKVTSMVMVSLVAHAALVTAVAFAPSRWGAMPVDNANVMTISLGGAPGPKQGLNPISSRPIQEAVPETVKPNAVATPALAKPEMIEPVKTAKPEPRSTAKPEPKKEEQLRGSKPTQGAEVKAGSAKVETHGAAIPFGGLATTGGGGAGQAYTDYANFCCPEYLAGVTDLIRKNWNSKQGQDGSAVIKFSIRRDGTVVDVIVEQGSNQILNLASQRAILLTPRVPPLPAAFPPEQLTLHLVFQYQR